VTDADVVRAMYDALDDADVQTFTGLLDPDIEWTVPGRHALAGTTIGVPSLLAHLADVVQRTAGQVSVDVKDILEGASYTVAVVGVEMAVDGRTVRDHQVHLFELRDQHVVSVREYHGDERAFDDLFGVP
jgi:ketosteroid isomerase-like protein